MNSTIRLTSAVLVLFTSVGVALGDTVQLENGDLLKGRVESLDDKELELSSESFGKLTIPREQVEAIYLGEARPPVVVVPGGEGPQGLSSDVPSLNNPQVQQLLGPMLNNLLGEGSDVENLQDNVNRARDQLRDLQKDMGVSEKQALQGYIDLFNFLSPPAQRQPSEQQPEQQQPGQQEPAEGATESSGSPPDAEATNSAGEP